MPFFHFEAVLSTMEQTTVVVGTWAFSAEPVQIAGRLINEGRSCEDSLETALNAAEADERYGPCQVGRGGPPNEKGEVELDAAIMSGSDLSFGAVTALQRIAQASSVARLVKDRSAHSMLTAQGAQDFAVSCGVQLDSDQPSGRQAGDSSARSTTKHHADPPQQYAERGHDTLGVIALDSQGNIAAGVTTSGMKGKARGRIGDSPLPGCGLYADNEVGAVCCSGEGDQIIKFCPSFLIMEFMRQGMPPEEACRTAVRRINKRISPSSPFELAIIAVSNKGEVGAATTVREWTDAMTGTTYPGFPLAVWTGQRHDGAHPDIRVVRAVE